MKPEIRCFPNLSDLSRAAAEYICEIAEGAVKERNIFTLVLSGGSTPRLLYEALGRQPICNRMDWQHTHLFWGDERCVPPEHVDSNYALALQALISKVDIPASNVHRIHTESGSGKAAAEGYEKSLRRFFRSAVGSQDDPYFPSFDLVLLGLGQDGHTASLFPGDAALKERDRWVVAVDGASGSPPVPRITLTFPAINQARFVLFLVSGSNKREVFQEIVKNPETAAYPAAGVKPYGRLLWFIDESLV